MSMRDLYQQIILEHARDPHGQGQHECQDGELCGSSHQVNPMCGDEVSLQVAFAGTEPEDVITDVRWQGQGCSISQASLSVMTELVVGRTRADADHIATVFRELMDSRGRGLDELQTEELGDAAAFAGVSKFPARIKCALLGWAALRDSSIKAASAPERTS